MIRSIAERLTTARVDLGLSQKEIALAIWPGKPEHSGRLGEYERGVRRPNPKTLARWQLAIGLERMRRRLGGK